DVPRLASADAQPAPLPDGEVVVPPVGGQPAARAIHHLSGAIAEPRVTAEELALALAGEKAEVLALGPPRDLETGGARLGADPELGQLAEGEPEARQRRGSQSGEHVRLVLRWVRGRCEQRAATVIDDPCVVPGGQRCGAETVGERDHRVDPQLAVAEHPG